MIKTSEIGTGILLKIRVMIVENDDTWRFLYRQTLQKLIEVEIVAEFERAEVALQTIPQLCPDVAIVDISLPGMSGLEFAEKMREYSTVRVILVTSHRKEYLSHNNPHGFLVIDKSNTREIMENIKTAVLNPGWK